MGLNSGYIWKWSMKAVCRKGANPAVKVLGRPCVLTGIIPSLYMHGGISAWFWVWGSGTLSWIGKTIHLFSQDFLCGLLFYVCMSVCRCVYKKARRGDWGYWNCSYRCCGLPDMGDGSQTQVLCKCLFLTTEPATSPTPCWAKSCRTLTPCWVQRLWSKCLCRKIKLRGSHDSVDTQPDIQ